MESKSAPIIEIRNRVQASTDASTHVAQSRLAIDPGDVMAVITDSPASARHLLRVLATLEWGDEDEYFFEGRRVDPKNYRQCLAVKGRIGYAAADAAMISNRTLRENLLLRRFYQENDLTIDIDETMGCLCEYADLTSKLDQRPSVLSVEEARKAIAIREMTKAPAVMLLEQPEHFMQMQASDALYQYFDHLLRLGTAVVFFSNNDKMTGIANRRLVLDGGTMRTLRV